MLLMNYIFMDNTDCRHVKGLHVEHDMTRAQFHDRDLHSFDRHPVAYLCQLSERCASFEIKGDRLKSDGALQYKH